MAETFENQIKNGDHQYISNQLHAPCRVKVNILSRLSQSGAMLACIHNQPDVLEVFISAKADLCLKDFNGCSAFTHASRNINGWNGDADGKWPRLMDKLIAWLMQNCPDGENDHEVRKEALKQLAAVNVLKTVRYILRADTYAATRDSYLRVMEEDASETTKIQAIKEKADNDSEMSEMRELALWELAPVEVTDDGFYEADDDGDDEDDDSDSQQSF